MGFGLAPEEYEIRRGFLSETSEMLEDTEADFLRLEENPSDKTIIERIFRLAHTIKGSAQLVEFHELGAFAHALEFLLVKVRENKVTVTTDVIDVLLKSNDLLKTFVEALQVDHSAKVSTDEVLARLNDFNKDPIAESSSGAALRSGAGSGAGSASASTSGFATSHATPVPVSGSPENGVGSDNTSDLAALCMRTHLLHMQLLQLHGDEIMTCEMMLIKGELETNLKALAALLKN